MGLKKKLLIGGGVVAGLAGVAVGARTIGQLQKGKSLASSLRQAVGLGGGGGRTPGGRRRRSRQMYMSKGRVFVGFSAADVKKAMQARFGPRKRRK